MAPLAVVIPTCRPESLKTFVVAWQDLFEHHNIELIVIEDNQKTWATLPEFIPHRTGSIRSLGFLRAYQWGYDVITLDDDCLPAADNDPIQEYLNAWDRSYAVSDYFDVGHTFGLSEYMRGYPFGHRTSCSPLLQYGGWDNVPDMDAITQQRHERHGTIADYRFDRRVLAIPLGLGFTGCIMNLAIKHEALPMMYQLIMGNVRVGYDRWDDIWSGLFAKKICDHLRIPILINGKASIVHTRASDTASNMEKERGGYHLNEFLWERLNRVVFESDTVIGCYRELISQLEPGWFGAQGYRITEGMVQWLDALDPHRG